MTIFRKKRIFSFLFRNFFLIAISAIFILPLIWVVSASLRQPGLPPPKSIDWIPSPLVWRNYLNLADYIPLGRLTLNSLIVTISATLLTLITASWAGMAMAQLRKKEQRKLLSLSVALLMVPLPALWLTRFVLFSWLGIIDSYWALILPALMGSSPLFVLLFYSSFRRLPIEFFEYAHLEGANVLYIWWKIAIPLSLPTAASVGVLSFSLYWGDFISPLLYLKSEKLYTLPVGLHILHQLDETNWSYLMAASVVMIIPVIILLVMVQKWFFRKNQLEKIYYG